MKKGIILTTNKNGSTEQEVVDWVIYGHEHGYQMQGNLCYSFLFPFLAPDKFVKQLEENPVDTFFIDDECMIYANVYNDNKLVNELNKKGLHVYHRELQSDLESICSVIDDELKVNIKKGIDYALHEMIQDKIRMVVITQDQQQNVFIDTLDGLASHLDIEVFPIAMPEFNPQFEAILEKTISENNINTVVVLDEEVVSPEFKDAIERLSRKYEFNYEYANNEQKISFSMGLNIN